ncbi:MAG: heterodisulfide reductase-related iron-sulfur binding cluster [Gammaproteobacteria bacterium]
MDYQTVEEPRFPLEDADRCVKCGLCLPHCPTWLETGDEGDSPRGRIALMQGLASGQLKPDPVSAGHLDRCLDCRACERVCPANVPYGKLIDAARAHLYPARTVWDRRLHALVARPGRLRRFGRVVRALRRLGLLHLGARGPWPRWLRRLASMPGPADAPPAPGVHPGIGERRGRVALFIGCLAGEFDTRTARDAVFVLTRLGYEVTIPENQGCCGALDQHAGQPDAAREFAHANLSAFTGGFDAIITTASGCAATLLDYPRLAVRAGEGAEFAARVLDISSFLVRRLDEFRDRLGDVSRRVVVHQPCTLRNVLRGDADVARLIGAVPGVTVAPLPGDDHCCGAAGSYVINQRAMSARLLEREVRRVRQAAPDWLLSSNIGCAMQLRAGLTTAGRAVTVRHPVSLVAESLAGRQPRRGILLR